MENKKITCLTLLILFLCRLPISAAINDEWEWTKSAGWSRSEGKAKETAKEQFSYAFYLEQKGNYYDAARQYFLLVRTFPNSSEASKGLTRLAECLFEMENYYASFKAIEQCINQYPKSIHLVTLLELEYRIGKRFLQGAPASLFGSKDPQKDSLLKAVEIFDSIVKRDAFGPLADDAYCELGMAYLELNKPAKAKDKLSFVIANFPESSLVPLARYRIALAKVQLGQGTIAEASKRLKELKIELEQTKDKNVGGMSAKSIKQTMADLQEKDAGRMFTAAYYYEKRNSPKSYDAAIFTYKEIIRRYPGTETSVKATQKLNKLRASGRPKVGLEERRFSLPNLPLPKVSKIPGVNKVAFWRKKTKKNNFNTKTATKSETQPVRQGYSGADLRPVEGNLYQVGKVVIDLDEEESKLTTKPKPQSLVVQEVKQNITKTEPSEIVAKVPVNEEEVLIEVPGEKSKKIILIKSGLEVKKIKPKIKLPVKKSVKKQKTTARKKNGWIFGDDFK